MARDTGFFQLRRGIWEHVRDGRMSITEAVAFIYIGTQADTRNGIWKGSAKSLSGELGIPERTARDVLEKMEHGDYIRRFAVPGRHACYPILVHKFMITNGEHNGEQLNALSSTSHVDLAYFPREQSVKQDGEHSVEHGAAQKRSKTVEEKHPQPPKKQEADPRFQGIVDTYYQGLKKAGIEPTCDNSDFGSLNTWLRRNPKRPLQGIVESLGNAIASTIPYPLRPGFRLREFLEHESKYQRGPLLKAGATPVQPIAEAIRTLTAEEIPA